MKTIDRLSTLELQDAILGSILGSALTGEADERADGALAAVPDEMLSEGWRRGVWSALRGLRDAGHAVELTLLGERLKASGVRYDQEDLLDLADQFDPFGWEPYAELLAAKVVRRSLMDRSAALARACADESVPEGELLAMLDSLGQVARPPKAPVLRIGEIQADDEDGGVTTGYAALDGLLSTRGYPSGQVTIARAYHKGGKTAFMLASARRIANAGGRVLYATFADLSSKQIKRRLRRQETGWGVAPKDGATLAEWNRFVPAWESELGIDVYDASALAEDQGSDVETFAAWLRAAHAKHPYDAVFVDYAQELSSRSRKATNEVGEQQACASVIARLAAQTELPIVVGSQITEPGKDGGRVKTKWGRAWEEKAGWVLTLKREEGEDTIEIESTYCRFGEGKRAVRLGWSKTHIDVTDAPASDLSVFRPRRPERARDLLDDE